MEQALPRTLVQNSWPGTAFRGNCPALYNSKHRARTCGSQLPSDRAAAGVEAMQYERLPEALFGLPHCSRARLWRATGGARACGGCA